MVKDKQVHSSERRELIREQQLERMQDEEYRNNSVRNLNDTTRENYLKSCPDCNRTFNAGNYKHHMDWHKRLITKEI